MWDNNNMKKSDPAEEDKEGKKWPQLRIEHTCCFLGFVIGISIVAAFVGVTLTRDTAVVITKLRQVHVLMSHGERTPNEQELAMLGAPPPDHVFAPYGPGAMTNEGKLLTYEMGVLLRNRYNEFLGPYYDPSEHSVIASDIDISKMTALLISAGLWQPQREQTWNDSFQWQPIPYAHPTIQDDILLFEKNCPRYKQEKQRVLDNFIAEGLLAPYKDLFHRIAIITNTNFSTPEDAFNLSNLFWIQDDIRVANPKWAKHVKRKLMEIARLEFSMMFQNNLLRKLSGGALLNQIINEAYLVTIPNKPDDVIPKTKLYLRTATRITVAALLATCVAPPPRLPDPGAAILFELHEQVDDGHKFGFKIFYWDDDSAEPRLMEVPGCNTFCPFDTFRDLTKYVVSEDFKKNCELVLPPSG